MNQNQPTPEQTPHAPASKEQAAAAGENTAPIPTEQITEQEQNPSIEDQLTKCLTDGDPDADSTSENESDFSEQTDPAPVPVTDEDGTDTDEIAFPDFPERSEDAAAAAMYAALQAGVQTNEAADTTDASQPLFRDIDSPEYTDDTDTEPTAAAAAPAKAKKCRWPLIVLICIVGLIACYSLVAFPPSGPIAGLRDMYIQTAMSTADHQWLATAFFPDWVIKRAWTDPNVKPEDVPDDFEGLQTAGTDTAADSSVSTDTEEPPDVSEPVTEPIPEDTTNDSKIEAPNPESDILGLTSLKVGDTDYAGNTVTKVDVEEGLFVSEFSGKHHLVPIFKHHGYVMLIDDPSRVFIGSTPEKDKTGYRILDMMNYYGDVVAGINASGFSDPNDQGTGNDIIGACMSEGLTWGRYTENMQSVVLTKENILQVGWLPNWSKYTNIRDGMQFGPALVKDGKNLISEDNGGGWGPQPRTAIGQRADGVIIMIVIDGRVSSSDGCTLWEMAEMMIRYGAVTAGGCDGGSSVVMAYDGEILNDNSSANPDYGRRIPNAFLVRSKKSEN